ncbi:hypothetical protein LOTGIDRAFT_161268 [Lottia gigantea]|uniref:PDZ domain-containing protein n=1 Tax=Lottia gigantea TaxID=225164 RepID=V4ALU4_LOTGI|nr:hypothetical protein LOTGIDRAFT_161268 [Lottia gigantea]ESO94566.1 hypothetical protein LOTGIDRAFT_161268 [Lottia gigantea]
MNTPIKRLLPSGVCARDQKLQIGDRLVSCNGQSLKGVTQNECLNILKSAGNDLKLTVLSSDNLAHLGMDSNTDSDTESVNNNFYKNGFEDVQHSEHGLSASKTNANVLFAQQNVKLAYTPPYIPHQVPSDSESSVASTPSKETQSVISEVDQHILDLTGLETSQLNGMESSAEHNLMSDNNSLLESIPPPVEFSDNPISPEESETSTLTDRSDTSLPVTNLDDLLGNNSTATNMPIRTTSTPIHNASSMILNSFPEHDELLTVVSTSNNVVQSDASDKFREKIPYTDIDNVQTSSAQNSKTSSNNILEFDTKVSNVIEGGQATTLFDIGVKSVSDAGHVSQTSNIDDLLFLDQTNIQQSSSNSSVEINNEAVSQEQNVSPQVNVLNSEQTNEKTSKSTDNVTTVQVGLISLDPNGVVDEGLVTKVPIIDLDNPKHGPQIENQVTQVVVNERPKITKVDVGYDKSNSSHRHENEPQIPGATVFSVDDDVKESNTARITIDNPTPPVPTPRLSPQVVPRKHLTRSEGSDSHEKQRVPSSPTPLPRKTHAHSVVQTHFQESHQEPSLTLNTAKLVEAAKPSATIVVCNSDQDITKSGNNIETDVNQSVKTITESKPTLIHDSEKDQVESSKSIIDTSQKSQNSTITVKTPRLKSSKEERSDRSGKVMVTTCQTSDIRLFRPVEEEESIQPMTFVQDELGNRNCVPTPPNTPKRQPKKKDEGAKKELTDILMNLVNLESTSDNDGQPESTVIEEGLIEPQKVSRQTMETVLGAFSGLIPSLDKPQKKSIFQKAVSEVIDDIDDDNNNVPKDQRRKSDSYDTDETDSLAKTKKASENSKPVKEIPSVLHSGFASISEALQSKSNDSATYSENLKEKDRSMSNKPNAFKLSDSSSVSVSQNVREKPKDIESRNKPKESTQKNRQQDTAPNSEKAVPKPSLISATAPKKISPTPHITTIRTQPFSSFKSGLTSFSTNKASKADYPKRRCEDQPFQVDVLKGIAGLGIKLAVGNDGLVKVTNIQTSGPVAKNGQVK